MARPLTHDPSSRTYGAVAITLHWLIAAAILYELWLGETIGPEDFKAIQTHKSLGITILTLSVLRLVWRLVHRPPPLPASMPTWERIGAHISHWGFYVLMIGVPLLGWAFVSASPHSDFIATKIWGLFQLPLLPVLPTLANREAVSDSLIAAHGFFAFYGFLGLLALHVGAALKHQFWDRDSIVHRMIPVVPAPRDRL